MLLLNSEPAADDLDRLIGVQLQVVTIKAVTNVFKSFYWKEWISIWLRYITGILEYEF